MKYVTYGRTVVESKIAADGREGEKDARKGKAGAKKEGNPRYDGKGRPEGVGVGGGGGRASIILVK